jgi:hypothetical protein
MQAHAKETIQKLKQEIANLSKLVEQGAGLSIGQEHSVKELLKIKDELTKGTLPFSYLLFSIFLPCPLHFLFFSFIYLNRA